MAIWKLQSWMPGGAIKGTGKGGGLSSTQANSVLSILENSRKKEDNFLSNGDLDFLIDEANKMVLQFNQGTQSGRNSVAELRGKISDYEFKKSQLKMKTQDVAISDTKLKNSFDTEKLMTGNNPSVYFNNIVNMLNQTSREINTKYQNALNSEDYQTANALMETGNKVESDLQLYQSMQKSYQETKTSNAKNGDVAVFINTDANGQPVSIDYGQRTAINKSGFMPTNSYLDNLQIFLQPNTVNENGKPSALLNGKLFVASDTGSGVLDVNGTELKTLFVNNPITEQKNILGVINYNKEVGNELNFKPEEIQLRGYIPKDNWAYDGANLYQSIGGGNFIKYNSTTPESLGLKEGKDYQKVNNIWASRINERVNMSKDPNAVDRQFQSNTPSFNYQEQPTSMLPTATPQFTLKPKTDNPTAQKALTGSEMFNKRTTEITTSKYGQPNSSAPSLSQTA